MRPAIENKGGGEVGLELGQREDTGHPATADLENKGGLGHQSLGRGKILRQQDNRIRITHSNNLNIIKAEGTGGWCQK